MGKKREKKKERTSEQVKVNLKTRVKKGPGRSGISFAVLRLYEKTER